MTITGKKITLIKRGACRTSDIVMIFIDGKYVGTAEKSAVKAYLKVCGYVH